MGASGKTGRRKFLKTSGAVAAGLGLAGISRTARGADERPNLLIILADQDRYPMHTPALKRPTLDRLRRNGLEFTNAFCAYPLCSPSRTALLTGKYPHQAGVYKNIDTLQKNDSLSPALPNLGSVFSAAGYETAYFGKWHLSRRPHTTHNYKKYGFQTFRLSNQSVAWNSDPRVLAWAADWIRSRKDSRTPWFMICAPINPHDICFPALSRLYGKIPDYPVLLPPNFTREPGRIYPPLAETVRLYEKDGRVPQDESAWLEYLSFYCFLTEEIDRQIGVLLEALAQSPRAENTLVIYTSDHGEMGGSHGQVNKAMAMYEENIHIPLVISAAGIKNPGRSYDGLCLNLDLAPTLCGLSGREWPESLIGQDLSPLVFGENIPEREQIFCEGQGEYNTTPPWRGLRTKKWKYWQYLDGAEFLFDLEKDPYEITNRAGEESFSEITLEFRAKVRAFRRETRDPFPEFL